MFLLLVLCRHEANPFFGVVVNVAILSKRVAVMARIIRKLDFASSEFCTNSELDPMKRN